MARDRQKRTIGLAATLVAAGLIGLPASQGWGAERTLAAGGDIQAALAEAAAGDTLRLAPGRYAGALQIDRPITIEGGVDSVIDGGGQGSVITVSAPGVTLRGLTIKNSGARLDTEDSGIFVDKDGDGALIENNRLDGNLIGIFLKGPEGAIVRGNRIIGRDDLRMNERGNGVQLWNTPGSVVEDNNIRYGRDGIFVTTSEKNVFRDNHFRDLRFAIHYMYTNRSEVIGNRSSGNHAGYAIMFSDRLVIRDNRSEDDRDHGFLLNYANRSEIVGNSVVGGAEKCVFIYNANKNRFTGNRFEGCDIGIHFTAGSERNEIDGNDFVGNRTQVKYVGTRDIEWSRQGRGNYWSDNTAYDLDGDSIADRPYRPNDLADQIVWRHPLGKLLLNSPALQILRWAQSELPALHPGGVTDSYPLIQPRGIDGEREG